MIDEEKKEKESNFSQKEKEGLEKLGWKPSDWHDIVKRLRKRIGREKGRR